MYVIKVGWILQPFNIMAQATGKMSVALLILRLLGPSALWRKRFLYISIILTPLFAALACIFTFAQCDPVRTLWEGLAEVPKAKCWNPDRQLAFSLFDGSKSRIFKQISSTRIPAHILKAGTHSSTSLWHYYQSRSCGTLT